MQTGSGAAGRRDDGVDAPDKTYRTQDTEWQALLANLNFAWTVSGFSILRARDGARRRARTIIHGHG
jgi:hypothetical protein